MVRVNDLYRTRCVRFAAGGVFLRIGIPNDASAINNILPQNNLTKNCLSLVKLKRTRSTKPWRIRMEAPTGVEPVYAVLQTAA